MHEYLGTEQGHTEIQLVISELEKYAASIQEADRDPDLPIVPPEMKKKKNIHEIFKKFDADGSDSIDRIELKVLLNELQVPMTEDEFNVLFDSLDEDGEGDIGFEEFYNWFVKEADSQRKKNRWSFFKSALKGGVFLGFKRMVLEVEARNLILDCAVHRAVEESRKEFRNVHPPRFLCEQCGESFPTPKTLGTHMGDKKFHKIFLAEKRETKKRFELVDRIFEGNQGRILRANRELFSSDLGPLHERTSAATLVHFRPFISDPEGIKRKQLAQGAIVQGFDPRAGLRAKPRQKGLDQIMLRSGLGSGSGSEGSSPSSVFTMLTDLSHARDDAEKVDIVVAPAPAAPAEIRFQWNGEASYSCKLKGEFTGWKEEEMWPDPSVGKFFLVKRLCPGRYRYVYVIDGKEAVDEMASVISEVQEGKERNRKLNILCVINPRISPSTPSNKQNKLRGSLLTLPPVPPPPSEVVGSEDSLSKEEELYAFISKRKNHVNFPSVTSPEALQSLKHFNVRNLNLCDDGAWAFASQVKNNSLILSLDLSFNNISDEGVMAIASCLPSLRALHTLRLNGNGFGVDGCRYLKSSVKECSSITSLEFGSNNIGDDGAEVLASLLTHNNHLKELFLDSCLIHDLGLQRLAQSLLNNKSLLLLSLSNNKFGSPGAIDLSKAMQANNSLTSLNLSNNPLRGTGAKLVAESIRLNQALVHLDLSHVALTGGMLLRSGKYDSNKDVSGLVALCFTLERNRILSSLNLRGNTLDDADATPLAESLAKNRGLTELDLRDNKLNEQWFQPNTYISTKLNPRLPTIQTSLDYNKSLLSEDNLSSKYTTGKGLSVDPEFEGHWTWRGNWRKDDTSKLKFRLKQLQDDKDEEQRMRLEEEYVEQEVKSSLDVIRRVISSKQGERFLRSLASIIIDLMHAIARSVSSSVPVEEKPSEASEKQTKSQAQLKAFKKEQYQVEAEAAYIKFQQSKPNTPSLDPSMQENEASNSGANLVDTKKEANVETKEEAGEEGEGGGVSLALHAKALKKQQYYEAHRQLMLAKQEEKRLQEEKENELKERRKQKKGWRVAQATSQVTAEAVNSWMQDSETQISQAEDHKCCVAALVSVLFRELGADPFDMLLPQAALETLFAYLCLPLKSHEDSELVAVEVVVGDTEKAGFNRVCKYLHHHGKRLARRNSFQRLRILADMYLNPPLHEAKLMVLDHMRSQLTLKIRNKYRRTVGREPLYVCPVCEKRFPSQKGLLKHTEKGPASSDHKRFEMCQFISQSQEHLLQKCKTRFLGTTLPAYFSLVPIKSLPRDYSPQILDELGDSGRPQGVIASGMTYRAVDLLGDYLKVAFEGNYYWTRHCDGPLTVLESACIRNKGFSWKDLRTFSQPVYYQVRMDIDEKAAPKVRTAPITEDRDNVCGYLQRGQVVRTYACLGNWIQIQFENQDSAWTLQAAGEGSIEGGLASRIYQFLVIDYFKHRNIYDELVYKREKRRLRGLKVKGKPPLTLDQQARNLTGGLGLVLEPLHPAVQTKLSNTQCELDRLGKTRPSPFLASAEELSLPPPNPKDNPWLFLLEEEGGAMPTEGQDKNKEEEEEELLRLMGEL